MKHFPCQTARIPCKDRGDFLYTECLLPGDWLERDGLLYVVIENWPVVHKLETMNAATRCCQKVRYSAVRGACYLGRGRRRKWLAWLPSRLARLVVPYGKPRKRT